MVIQSHLYTDDLWDQSMSGRGIFARNSSEQIKEIADGVSFTLLVAERGVTSGAGIWAGVTDNVQEDDAVTDCSHRSRPNSGWTSYSSRHDGGINGLLYDGSWRFLSRQIDSRPKPGMGTYQRLACKNDGQELGDF